MKRKKRKKFCKYFIKKKKLEYYGTNELLDLALQILDNKNVNIDYKKFKSYNIDYKNFKKIKLKF